VRWLSAIKDKALDPLRRLVVLETRAEQFLKVLEAGTVSTNSYLQRIHRFALDMSWLPWPVLPKKRWPQVRFKEKRAVTALEHQAIVVAEANPERRAFYEFCWHLGGAQSDVANLSAEDIDWQAKVVSFSRRKTGTASIIRIGCLKGCRNPATPCPAGETGLARVGQKKKLPISFRLHAWLPSRGIGAGRSVHSRFCP
jgi:hypothetical protein